MHQRKILPFVFLVFGMLFIRESAAGPLPVFKKLEEGEKQTVIVYGTSLTAGGEWTKAMKAWFEEKYPGQVKFINSGGSGMNSDWGLKNLDDKVRKHKPDLVFVEFSYNDAHTKFKLTPEKAAGNLDGIIGGVQKSNPDAAIVLQTMNVPWNAPNGNGNLSWRPQLQAFNEVYRAAAKSKNLPLVDHYSVWSELLENDPETYHKSVPDGSHPSKEASLAVTWKALKDWLEESKATSEKK